MAAAHPTCPPAASPPFGRLSASIQLILLLLQLDVDHNLLLLLPDQLLPLLHSIMNYSYTNTVSFPGKPEVTKG